MNLLWMQYQLLGNADVIVEGVIGPMVVLLNQSLVAGFASPSITPCHVLRPRCRESTAFFG